ncbi:MAG: acetylxylan esterase [Planctomycetaceae bacterium]|jgi:hypothetical protein|nr:acetylxylan esterase [Planctomycetaceae bacterium]
MSFFHVLAFSCAVLFAAAVGYAQQPVAPANYDEAKVPKFDLPDPLKTSDGRNVDSAQLWNEVRRPELLKLFEEQMFGQTRPLFDLKFEHDETILAKSTVFNGKGTQWQIHLHLVPIKEQRKNDYPYPQIVVLIYTPNNVTRKTPAFIGLNFQGNHTVSDDPGITLGMVWKDKQCVPATEEERGNQKERWQIEKILDRGYAVATAYYEDIEPDFDGGSQFGMWRLIDQKGKPNEGNAIATWAWGLSMIYDVLAAHGDLNIDLQKIAVMGHSRLGKTALWAGAMDSRFAMVISNNSGCGGAALSRREYGETVHRINTSFPHWFCGNFKKYNLDVNALPFDQHELIALMAPRPVYIASAEEDQWADPKGEFLSGLYADPVYRLLGTDGIAGVMEMPKVNRSVGGTIGYHIRTGQHDVTEYDWEQYLNFADKHLR